MFNQEGMGLHYSTEITPQTDLESCHRRLPKMLYKWLCNVQLFPRVWILKISRKAYWISLSVSGPRLKAVFWISVTSYKLTILSDIQPANRIVIISGVKSFNFGSV